MAGFEMKEGDYVVGFWIACIPKQDFFGGAIKKANGDWDVQYRFRYHKDEKTWHSDDEKRWYRLTFEPCTHENTIIELFETLLKRIHILGYGKHDFVKICSTDPEKIMAGMKSHPALHSKEGAEAEQYNDEMEAKEKAEAAAKAAAPPPPPAPGVVREWTVPHHHGEAP